ncbi:DUF3800 domain-containing protein [Parenemella sanctibonifatiensis]|uniref:DUF3800 domain-containing protein n=1 Tax=Parenemella sanctibonifatiensis TaxID=2016505 RepID=UPI0015C5ABDD|nr:DUF3800 domain-containing protein [Parenemella sanctibonifatiensis]
MAEFYVYLDETGSPDYSEASGPRFAIGSATFEGDHRDSIWEGFQLRARLESEGIRLEKGFHAADDSRRTRGDVFAVIQEQPPSRFDFTYLTKAKAYPSVRAKGKPYLYQLALFLHLKHLVPSFAHAGDRVRDRRHDPPDEEHSQRGARVALADVCEQLSFDKTVTACLWEARSSWGIQVADYCSWAMQREMDDKPCQWYPTVVQPLTESSYGPWD